MENILWTVLKESEFSSGCRCRTVAQENKRDVVCLACTPCKILDGIEKGFLELIEGCVVLTVKNFPETRRTKQVLVGIHCLCDPIAE